MKIWIKVDMPEHFQVSQVIARSRINICDMLIPVEGIVGDLTQEIKMTREEATHAIFNSQAGKPVGSRDIPIKQFVEYVEALGLIKFDEPKKDMYNIVVDEKAASEFKASGYHVELRK